MSGIVGILNIDGFPVDNSLLSRLTDYLAFRGPNAQETWLQGAVGFGHTLLQTAEDCRPEAQPLSRDGLVLVADARIDGQEELRRKLKALGGSPPPDAPDGELILAAYQAWGQECVRHLIGDFAFAVWDSQRRSLFCARDHFGIKPFYYAQVNHSLIFSNTLNCVRLHPQVSDRLNDLAIADFLLFDFNQDQATTTFADIQRLPPSHYLTWLDGSLQVQRYWTLPQDGPLRYPRRQDYVDQFQELLGQAVADRLRTRRVGVCMSGGLDSSTVAATAKNLLQAQPEPFDLMAFTEVYDRLMPDRERHYSGLVAAHLGIPIHYHLEDDYKLYERMDQPELHWPEPYHLPLVASWVDLISRVLGHSRVILTGQGGDPILYPSLSHFSKMLKNLRMGQIIREVGLCAFKLRRLPQIGFRSGLRRLLGIRNPSAPYPPWLNPVFAARLDLPHRWSRLSQDAKAPHPLREEACAIFLDPFWAHVFERQYDAGAIGLPVEFRHPFFDVRLVSYALALPPIPWCWDKMLLREAGRGLLPERVRVRPKAPLAANPERELVLQQGAEWLDRLEHVGELAAFVDSAVLPPVAGEHDVLRLWMNLRPLSLNYWLTNWARGKAGNFPSSIDKISEVCQDKGQTTE